MRGTTLVSKSCLLTSSEIPQIRQRMYIVGSLSPLAGFQWPKRIKSSVSIHSVLDSRPCEAREIPEQVERCLDVWQEFLDLVPRDEKFLTRCGPWSSGRPIPFGGQRPGRRGDRLFEDTEGHTGHHSPGLLPRKRFLLFSPHTPELSRQDSQAWKVGFIRRNRRVLQPSQTLWPVD